MAGTCSICTDTQRAAINRALVAGESLRNIAKQFSVSYSALNRHKKNHLPSTLVEAKAAQDTADAIDVMAELERCFQRVNLLFDACDRWLRDADDPTRYDIGPRAEELTVTYEDVLENSNGDPYTVRRKRKLSELLPTIESETRTITMVETKYADPRELVLKTANRLQGQMELLSKLMGDLSDGTTINILGDAIWVSIRAEIVAALAPFPQAREAVAERLSVIEGGKSHAAD